MSYEFSVGCCSLFAILSGSDPLSLDLFSMPWGGGFALSCFYSSHNYCCFRGDHASVVKLSSVSTSLGSSTMSAWP